MLAAAPTYKKGHKPMSNNNKNPLVDARQPSGALAPVFPALLSDKSKYAAEEEYIRRMIERDKQTNNG
jgi:hypothetical protein